MDSTEHKPGDLNFLLELLDPQEVVVLLKTVSRLDFEYTAGGDKAAETYLSNLTPKQREVITKLLELAKQHDVARPCELEAFRAFGFQV